MTTPVNQTNDAENTGVSTIQRIYDDDIVIRNPETRRSFINKSAYAKLHRTSSSGVNRYSVEGLRGRFENIATQEEKEIPRPESFTPASFGYPKATKLTPPLIKPKPPPKKTSPKDVNSNEIDKKVEETDGDEVRIILQPTASQESVDKIASELSSFTMDGKPKKRGGSFRKFFFPGFFNKDKKKKAEDEKNKSVVCTDNIKNETHFNKQEEKAPTVKMTQDLQRDYAEFHVNRFNRIRQSFNQDQVDNRNPVPTKENNYTTFPIKYIDTSSSVESEQPKHNRDTPPRAQETYQNIQVVNPKLATRNKEPEESNRKEFEPPRTIERNLNKIDTKPYPEKQTFSENPEGKPPRPRISSEKLKLPPNREIYEPLPRVKSPIPTNRISTDKIIATELLKSAARSPTPTKRFPATSKPPSPNEIVTNVQVHSSQRAPTPVDRLGAVTPVELRKSVTMRMSLQKPDVKKSVEEYYWKQLKKMKEEQDSQLNNLQMNGSYDEQGRLRRSRSLSPNSQRARRSLSLPRERNYEMERFHAQSIPEDQALTTTNGRPRIYNQHFARNTPERRSVDNLQRPIFRRGSLTKPEVYETTPYNKRVSFLNLQRPSWPARNGYTPPQRRLPSTLEDDVFYTEPVYSNRPIEPYRYEIYAPLPVPNTVRRPAMDSRSVQDYYGLKRHHQQQRPVSNISQYDYANVQRYPSNTQLTPNGHYGSRASIPDKQITLRNKYCDIYGQIHDLPQSGTVMGQVQQPQVTQANPNGFVRGTRLTSSVNDLVGRRQYIYPVYNYDNRPLPPVPSDTESSDASEIQRIMQNDRKKRGLPGK